MAKKFCPYCQDTFEPNPCAGDRQKCCFKETCKRQRKKDAQKKWLEKNPGYFRGRYKTYVKGWLEKNPGYLKDYRKRSKQQKTNDIQDKLTQQETTHFLFELVDLQDELTSIISKNNAYATDIQAIFSDIQDRIIAFKASYDCFLSA